MRVSEQNISNPLLTPVEQCIRGHDTFRSLLAVVFHLRMDAIPEDIRNKLEAVGYDSVEKLPNTDIMDRWREVKMECGLSGPELVQLMNARFPIQIGNVIIA